MADRTLRVLGIVMNYISKQSPSFPEYLNFEELRKKGIDHLQRLSGKIWTDYNLHDPGVTILEVLCYAITDLGYRNNLELKDILTSSVSELPEQDSNFFTPDEILTCNPVTEMDIRRRLVDIKGVRNAWINKVEAYEPAIYINARKGQLQMQAGRGVQHLPLKGLYTVFLELSPEITDQSNRHTMQDREITLHEVKQVLHSHRNLCEDIYDVVVLGEEEIGLTADIVIEATANPDVVLSKIYIQIQDFLNPQVKFYTLEGLLNKGKSAAEIFLGRPSALSKHDSNTPASSSDSSINHGFIDIDEFKELTLPNIIHTSDLYQEILKVPGVMAIEALKIESYINELSQTKSQAYPWYLHLTDGYHPVLGIKQSRIRLLKQGTSVDVNLEEVTRRYQQYQIAHIITQKNAYELDLPVPRGQFYEDLADHYSIHHDFPRTYGIGQDGLPKTSTALRQAQAKQLKGYLVFFDQILANYLSQLANVRSLFSWDQTLWHSPKGQQQTYVTPTEVQKKGAQQKILDFPGFEEIIRNHIDDDDDTYAEFVQTIIEDEPRANQRRHRFLDHLLARFSETFTDHVLLRYQTSDCSKTVECNQDPQLMADKANFLKSYPSISHDRFRAFNYYQTDKDNPIHEKWNIAGLQKRLQFLLGIDNTSNPQCNENFYIVEHLLLRPRSNMKTVANVLPSQFPITLDSSPSPSMLPIMIEASKSISTENSAVVDPYSFWVSILLPSWPKRFQKRNFRKFVERTIRMEAPAHIALKIGWFDLSQMVEFEVAYYAWLDQFNLKMRGGLAYDLGPTLNRLVNLLSNLRSTYPQAVLTDDNGNTCCGRNPIVLT